MRFAPSHYLELKGSGKETRHSNSERTWAIIRIVLELRGKFIGGAYSGWNPDHSVRCLLRSGMPRSWDAGLFIMPGKQRQRRYVVSGGKEPGILCRQSVNVPCWIWSGCSENRTSSSVMWLIGALCAIPACFLALLVFLNAQQEILSKVF